jgi:glutamine synthetase
MGIKENLKLGDAVTGNAYAVQDQLSAQYQLASNLSDATEYYNKSAAARELFGTDFVDHFVSSRRWEVREYEKAITDWQLQRYFEII